MGMQSILPVTVPVKDQRCHPSMLWSRLVQMSLKSIVVGATNGNQGQTVIHF